MQAKQSLLVAARRLLASLVCACLVLLSIPAFAPQALADSGGYAKTVKVGWLSNNEGFQEGVPGGYMSGWGYEYLQTLSYYTPGWRYEYVTGTFSELMDKLESGEIDLMPNISYTAERAGKMLYSTNPQGTERYYIYAKSDRDALTKGNPKALDGLTIGANNGVMQTTIGMQWLKDQGIKCKYRFYDTGNELFDALAKDKVDAIIMNDTLSSEDAMPMFFVGETNYYVVTAKGRADIMDDVNQAMAQIQSANPRYNDEVKTRYSVNNGGANSLTTAERAWLARHQNTVSFGYLDDWLPYSGRSAEGELEGSLSALASTIEEQYGVQVRCRAYATVEKLESALSDGEVNVAMPACKDYWLAEQGGFIQSSALSATSVMMVYPGGDTTEALKTIAYSSHGVIDKDVISVRYPDAQLVECATPQACIEAVKSGKASSTLVCGTRLDSLRESCDFGDLKTAELSGSVELVCLMNRGDAELLSIVDKGIAVAGVKIADGTYAAQDETEASALGLFVSRHQGAIATVGLAVLVLVIVVLSWSLARARAAQKEAQRANAAKSAFLARMSHDIRTPLNGIVGLIEVDELTPDDVVKLKENRDKAKVAANHLLTLINDILEMSKIEDRAIVLEDKPFDLRRVIDDVIVLGQLRASERGVTLVSDGGAGLEFSHVYGSPVHVRRVLLNIVDNCIKYNKPGGKVVCTTKTLGSEGGRTLCRIVVEDTGIGMSEEFLKHIFEPFAQEKDDARSHFQGTGMGMPIVKGLVDKMGGTIEVSSKAGEGSVFVIELPFKIDTAPESHAKPAEQPGEGSIADMSILLVEDNELNCEIAQTLLVSAGARVVCAANGKDAVEIYESHEAGTFDAVLMDIMMPVMDGYEACRAMRLSKKADAASIPIIAMTANAFVEDAQSARDAGMNAHISKPIDINVVRETLSRLCER